MTYDGASLNRRFERLAEIESWFAERGFGLFLTEEEGGFWSHVFSKRSLQVTAPAYGRGATPEAAAERARERYRVEEEGESV